MRYRATKVSNVEEYLYKAIGDAPPLLIPKWELHSVVPSIVINNKVEQWLVVLQTTDEVP